MSLLPAKDPDLAANHRQWQALRPIALIFIATPTTMKILTGTLAPTSGDVRVNGISLSEDPKSAKRHLGYLPDQPPVAFRQARPLPGRRVRREGRLRPGRLDAAPASARRTATSTGRPARCRG